jgi:hypothetical protein
MYRSYLLKNDFWAKKMSNSEIFLKHNEYLGGVYAIVQEGDNRGVKLIVDGVEHFFNNFDKLDSFLNGLSHEQDDFIKILKRKNRTKRLRKLEI